MFSLNYTLLHIHVFTQQIFLSTYCVPDTTIGCPGLGVGLADDKRKA